MGRNGRSLRADSGRRGDVRFSVGKHCPEPRGCGRRGASAGTMGARPGLGTLNHTALTVEVARKSGIKVLGVVLNDAAGRPHGIAERTNLSAIDLGLYQLRAGRWLTPDDQYAIVMNMKQAKEIGLVDELGDLEDAIKLAGRLGKIQHVAMIETLRQYGSYAA